ncbi:hypothetical protein BHM03_00004416 [Ensete ventricosum]|nr:hypothetical protein BHM03_00004416 [Ensete ventricosum]
MTRVFGARHCFRRSPEKKVGSSCSGRGGRRRRRTGVTTTGTIHPISHVNEVSTLNGCFYVVVVVVVTKDGRGSADLRSRGLCLVPVACTEDVTRSNGADLWSPAMGSGSRGGSSSSSKH